MKLEPEIKSIIFNCLFLLITCSIVFASCQKETEPPPPDPTSNLALDSIIATKKTIVLWEEILVTAYAKGENLTYIWKTNHGSMLGVNSTTVRYWACFSCEGYNTIECTVSNEFGSISDTIMVMVNRN